MSPSTLTKSAAQAADGRRRLFVLLLLLAAIRGVVYLAIVPPWQHYDEPTHFEYVRLLAERRRLPQPGDYDLEMRQEIVASMQAADFWRGLDPPHLDFWSETPPEIGISELEHPPLYYAWLAMAQFPLEYQSVETQLYVARLGSVLLLVVAVAAIYGLTAELCPRRPWLALVTGSFVAFLPPFTDLGSSVNNDIGAAAITSLFLWSSVRLLRRGPTAKGIAVTLILAGAGLVVKSTVVPIVGGGVLLMGLYYIPGRHRRWAWLSLLLLLPIVLLTGFTWQDQAAHWYSTPPTAPNRVTMETPLGSSALALSREGDGHPHYISQELGREASQELAGQEITVGAWLRTKKGAEGRIGLGLFTGSEWQWQSVQATAEWQFYTLAATVGPDAQVVSVRIRLPSATDGAQNAYIDGVILAEGSRTDAQPPVFEDAKASRGHWDGKSFRNLLLNGSAERAWPSLRPWIGEVEIYRTSTALVFQSLWDWQRTGWVYGAELQGLLQTFWGRFAWGHLALPGAYFYAVGLLTALAIAGAGIGLARHLGTAKSAPWQRWSYGLLALTLLLAWGSTLLRIHPISVVDGYLYWPVARYASGAIAPTALVLCGGLAVLIPSRWKGAAAYAGGLGLILMDTVAMWSVILIYYYG